MKTKVFPLIILLSLILVACGGAGNDKIELTIDMTEFAYDPAFLTLSVGDEVVITLTNSGDEPHEIMFGREVAYIDGDQPDGYVEDMFDHAGVEPVVVMTTDADDHDDGDDHNDDDADDHDDDVDDHDDGDTDDHDADADEHGHPGFMVWLPVGHDTATISFTVTEEMIGSWEIGCFEADGGHYVEGMWATLNID